MKAVILAAGKGKRLRPLTETRPKPLIPIMCKPLIDWHIEALLNTGSIDEIVIVASYMKEKLEEHIRDKWSNVKIRIVDQGEALGTGDAVVKGIEALKTRDRILIVYGDLFLGNWNIYRELVSNNKDMIVGVRVDNPREYGVLIRSNDIFKGVIEKPDNPPSNLVNAGIYFIDSRLIIENKDIEPSPRGELEFTDILNKIADKSEIHIYTINRENWIDIGRPWNLLEANKLALRKIKTRINGRIEQNVVIKGNVIVEKDAIIRSFTSIKGPAYIGKGAVIGPNARIRPYTSICEEARIGVSVEVKESIVFEHTHISHLGYVGDSIIGEHVNFGAGTITANLRFDDKPVKMIIKGKRVSSGRRKLGAVVGGYVKTGINVSLMPGIKIGSGSWIAPGAVVDHDVPAHSFYKWKGVAYIEPLRKD